MSKKAIGLSVVLVAITLMVALGSANTNVANAHGRCWNATAFYKLHAGGQWHWYAFVPKSDQNSNVANWHVHGPTAGLWPDSVTRHYVKVMFSFPNRMNPYLFLRPSQFQACRN